MSWIARRREDARSGLLPITVKILAGHQRPEGRILQPSGGELEQIQFLLGHVSVETTERYLGCKQRLRQAVNDKIGLEQ